MMMALAPLPVLGLDPFDARMIGWANSVAKRQADIRAGFSGLGECDLYDADGTCLHETADANGIVGQVPIDIIGGSNPVLGTPIVSGQYGPVPAGCDPDIYPMSGVCIDSTGTADWSKTVGGSSVSSSNIAIAAGSPKGSTLQLKFPGYTGPTAGIPGPPKQVVVYPGSTPGQLIPGVPNTILIGAALVVAVIAATR
jgi:hypothetical protein